MERASAEARTGDEPPCSRRDSDLAGIAMVQFLPTQELSALSARAQITYEKASEGSLGWAQLLTLIVPKFFGVSDAHAYTYWGPGPYWHYWETCIYFGVLPLLLTLMSVRLLRRNRLLVFLVCFALFALLFSLGSNFFLHSAFFYAVPGFASFRNPARMGVFLAFIGSLLSGFTLHALMQGAAAGSAKTVWRKTLIIIAGAAAVFVVLAQLGVLDGVFPFLTQVQSGTMVRKELLVALGFLAAGAALLSMLLLPAKAAVPSWPSLPVPWHFSTCISSVQTITPPP